MSAIITTSVSDGIAKFCNEFHRRWFHQPPEFSEPTHPRFVASWDLYDKPVKGTHLAESSWYNQVLNNATASDLDAMTNAFDTLECRYATAFKLYLLNRLLNDAYARAKTDNPASRAIPAWFRSKGWKGIPDDWV
jgi:hypothetical protein